jgi:glyoxylase-like metal-dependent hydrolase (beta-lactamase superfamily II)
MALRDLLAVVVGDVGGGGRGVVNDLDANRSPSPRLPLVMTLNLGKECKEMVERTHSAGPPTARFYKHRIGDVELIALSDGGLNYPTAMILGNVPPEAVAQYHLPKKQIFIRYTVLLIKTKDKLVLIDVGAGDLGNPGDGIFPGLDHSTSRTNLVLPSLKAAGIAPKEIDTILITHAHPDHIGGMFDPDGNLAFPTARYYVAQQEWDYWMSADPSAVGAEALRHHLELLVREAKRAFYAIQDRVTVVQGGEEVVPGIRFEPAYGHTPGHALVSVSAGDQRAYNISDVVVDPLFVEHPEWAPAIDMDAAQADTTRRRFFAQAARENALLFAHHLGPFPNLGRIVKWADAWQWQPIETEG